MKIPSQIRCYRWIAYPHFRLHFSLLLAGWLRQRYAARMLEVRDNNSPRIYPGDCLAVLKTLPDESIDLLLTDPPYGSSYLSRSKSLPLVRIAGDGANEAPKLTKKMLKIAWLKMKWNTHGYVFCDRWSYEATKRAVIEACFTLKNTLIWHKNNRTRGDLKGNYGYEDEWILFFHKGRRWMFGKRDGNVLSFKKVPTQAMQHPTEKPVELLEYLIQKSTLPGEVVLDPFMGIGSVCVAAKNTDRRYIGIEIEPVWYEVAKMRLG